MTSHQACNRNRWSQIQKEISISKTQPQLWEKSTKTKHKTQIYQVFMLEQAWFLKHNDLNWLGREISPTQAPDSMSKNQCSRRTRDLHRKKNGRERQRDLAMMNTQRWVLSPINHLSKNSPPPRLSPMMISHRIIPHSRTWITPSICLVILKIPLN